MTAEEELRKLRGLLGALIENYDGLHLCPNCITVNAMLDKKTVDGIKAFSLEPPAPLSGNMLKFKKEIP